MIHKNDQTIFSGENKNVSFTFSLLNSVIKLTIMCQSLVNEILNKVLSRKKSGCIQFLLRKHAYSNI